MWLPPLARRVGPHTNRSRNPSDQTMSQPADVPDGQLEPPADGRAWLNETVLGAGLTSALGDFCYETTTVLLPGFLAVLGVPAVALGLIEGIADAVSSFTKMGAGYFADKLGHRKGMVLLGYALTPIGQVCIALAAGWPLILCGRILSWFGKGLRGPLRDAIIAQAVTSDTKGRAFGFHRATDTIGAVLGPLIGVGLIGWAQGWAGADLAAPFRLVFWLTLLPGFLAVLAFLSLVRDPEQSPNPELRFVSTLRSLPPSFRRYLRAVGLFGLGNFSHSLLILAATQSLASSIGLVPAAQVAGLLYVGRNVVQVLASYPAGAAADRYGHKTILGIGYALGVLTAALACAASLMATGQLPLLAGIFTVAGIYAAIEDTLESTVSAEMVDPSNLATSYGALGMVTGVAKFVSSAGVGVLWSAFSPAAGFATAAIMMAIGTWSFSRSILR